jgi:ABC-type dipeptide/oligopeptide/nickel transport system permease component
MYKALARKLLEAAVTLFCATLVIFALTHLAPGDPVQLLLGRAGEVAASDSQAFDAKAAELRAQWGLDHNMAVQYAAWLKHLLLFDLGTSIYTGRPVGSEITERLPATFMLAITALCLQIALGLLLGIVSALKASRPLDSIIRLACVALASTPAFVIGLGLLSLCAVTLGIYEISSETSLSRLWLPALTLGLIGAPQLARMVRGGMLSEFGQTYVLSALARGLNRKHVVRHALRNALLPVVTMAGLSLTSLISGAVVIESIFSWPGIGKYALDSILLKDYPVIQGYAFVMVALVIGVHLLVDILYALIDPRIYRRNKAEVDEYA